MSSRGTPSTVGICQIAPDQQYDRAYLPPSPKEGAWPAVCVGVLGSDLGTIILTASRARGGVYKEVTPWLLPFSLAHLQ